MKRKAVIIVASVIVVAVAGIALMRHFRSAGKDSGFQFGEVARGDIENTVSSTGTLSAVRTVEVGSQVSGIIDKLYADFNDIVKKDQVLAKLDTTLLAAQVLDARAGLMRSRSQLQQAESEYQRNKPLFENGYLAESEWLTIKTTYEASRASYESAEAALQRAKTNLSYSTIRSPIDGTIIERNVDAGQTIAASFQAPKLFVIAQDLVKMQIEVNVDESDIGSIKTGMPVRFTVQAYPDDSFAGVVRQVRLQPTTIQNVVNYTVVVDATNDRGVLLPGMTATVDFIVDSRKDVLMVPNAALQVKPTDEMLATLRERMDKRRAERAQGERPASGETGAQAAGREARSGSDRAPTGGAAPRDSASARRWPRTGGALGGASGASGTAGGTSGPVGGWGANGSSNLPPHVFIVDDKGAIDIAFVRTGVTDGRNTEITESRRLTEGMKIITGANKTATKIEDTKTGSKLNLNPRPPGGARRGGPRF